MFDYFFEKHNEKNDNNVDINPKLPKIKIKFTGEKYEIVKCDSTTEKTKSNNISSETSVKRVKCNKTWKYSCLKCDYIRTTKDAADSHYRKVHLKCEPFSCSHCSYSTYNRDRYVQHTNNLRGCKEKEFRCTECAFITSSQGSLHNHSKVHQEKKEKCIYCYKMFHHLSNCKKHMKICNFGNLKN
jgi:hypothetical protein